MRAHGSFFIWMLTLGLGACRASPPAAPVASAEDIPAPQRETVLGGSISLIEALVQTTDPSSPEYPALVLRLGQFYEAEARAAAQTLAQLEEARPTAPDLRALDQERARAAATQRSRREEAQRCYQKVAYQFTSSPHAEEALYALGALLHEAGLTQEAYAVYEESLARYPAGPFSQETQLALAEQDFAELRFPEAIAGYQDAAKGPQRSLSDYARYKTAWSHYNLSDYAAALAGFVALAREAESATLRREAARDVVITYDLTGTPARAIDEFYAWFGEEAAQPLLRALSARYRDNARCAEAAALCTAHQAKSPRQPTLCDVSCAP